MEFCACYTRNLTDSDPEETSLMVTGVGYEPSHPKVLRLNAVPWTARQSCQLCRRGKEHFDVHFWQIRLALFPSKMEKAQPKREKWMERSLIPPESAFFVSLVHMIKILFPSCTLTWIVNNKVPRQGKSIFRWNKSTYFIIISFIVKHCTNYIEFCLFDSIDYIWLETICS